MSPQYTNYQQLLSSLGEKTIMKIVNDHLERVESRKEYNEKRKNDPGVMEKRKTYQRERNDKIKLALSMLEEMEKK